MPQQAGGAQAEGAHPAGPRGQPHPAVPVPRMRLRRGRGLQAAGPRAKGLHSIRRCGQQHHSGGGRQEGAGQAVSLGRGQCGGSGAQRFHQAAHLLDIHAHAGPQGHHTGAYTPSFFAKFEY